MLSADRPVPVSSTTNAVATPHPPQHGRLVSTPGAQRGSEFVIDCMAAIRRVTAFRRDTCESAI